MTGKGWKGIRDMLLGRWKKGGTGLELTCIAREVDGNRKQGKKKQYLEGEVKDRWKRRRIVDNTNRDEKITLGRGLQGIDMEGKEIRKGMTTFWEEDDKGMKKEIVTYGRK